MTLKQIDVRASLRRALGTSRPTRTNHATSLQFEQRAFESPGLANDEKPDSDDLWEYLEDIRP